MSGIVNRGDVLAHPIIVIAGFGWGVFFRALFGRQTTFLAVVFARGSP